MKFLKKIVRGILKILELIFKAMIIMWWIIALTIFLLILITDIKILLTLIGLFGGVLIFILLLCWLKDWSESDE